MNKLNFTIGKTYEFTKTFSESDVYLFAGIIGDFFPAHTNEEYCRKMPYKTRIVHGCLTFSLASTVSGIAGVQSGHDILAWGYDKLRFKKPVYFGDTITATYTFREIDEERMRTTADCVMTNQNGEVVLTCIHYMKVLP
jgi:acyl dehydratase